MSTRHSTALKGILDVVWCVVVPAASLGLYFMVGIMIVALVDDPILGTALLGVCFATGLISLRRFVPRWFDYRPSPRASTRAPRLRWLVATGMVLAFFAGQSLSMWLLGTIGSEGFEHSSQLRSEADLAVVLLLSLVVAPMGEEALLRGLIYPALRKRVSILVAVLVSAAVFALMHGNIVQIAATLPLAVLLALVYERTRSLVPCVLAHVGFNLAATIIPVKVLLIWANPFSIGLFTTAFLVCAWLVYQRVAHPIRAGETRSAEPLGSTEGEQGDPRAA